MTYEDDDLNDNDDDFTIDTEDDSTDDEQPSNKKNPEVRKRIDDLLERKRLKELLDDTDDW